ncbi:hypothetical protein O6H91_03G095400 [Diphasiastrum complanatum]|uniref:Uncharacterized protein n=1 Tax=Diphasiastrum complanatum TaxID=34168 RepID=A0ACC2E9Q7_DIPCM|nr:hypothetical protein O6H91_03G095400 [Diphasiastrum complanatum]
MTLKTVQVGDEVLRKGPWMPEEDEILVEYVRQFGPRDWSSIRSKGLLPRTGKSCRLRWVNKLKPDLKSGCKFSPEEETLVVEMQAKLGNKWAKIALCLPGRTDNDVKNFWSTRQKRLMRASQRPKTPSGKSENGTELSDMSKDSALNEFTAFQVQSPCHSPCSLTFGFDAPLFFGEDDVFREQQSHNGDRWRMRHDLLAFNSIDLDAVLSMKLQDCAGSDFPFTEMEFAGSARYAKDDVKPIPTLLKKSVKRRPRSRRGVKVCTQQLPIKPELPELGASLTYTSSCGCGTEPLFEETSDNYLDFVMLSESASVQSNKACCPEFSGFLLTSPPHWEKLPMLYLESDSGLDDCSKEGASTTPDSALSTISGDVFDSLEPLCQASSEWWAGRLT